MQFDNQTNSPLPSEYYTSEYYTMDFGLPDICIENAKEGKLLS